MNSTKGGPGKIVSLASKAFDRFLAEERFDQILYHFQNVCKILELSPCPVKQFYNRLKENVVSTGAKNIFQLIDKKMQIPVYDGGYAAAGNTILVIGSGPVGLRTAIEAQLLGANVYVVEKRTSFTRNNVLHLWPFVIEDLKSLGAKVLYPKFCTGSMNHISIRRIQCILVKISLIIGINVMGGYEFSGLIDPTQETGWGVKVSPKNDFISNLKVDMLVGAEGKRVTIPGFKRKEFRGKLAIAITANFINNKTTAEAVVEEISGVAFVYKQDFFNNLYEELGIALENIVYYKGETHYFVMTTKKHSLLDRKVLKKDCKDPIELLSPKNVNKKFLLEYIRDACDYCTDYQLPNMQFELNHHNEPDVALFDFTSMFAASNSAYAAEKNNHQLLLGLVGDGLLEPFWPTGTGCARGFLGAFDLMWMFKRWAIGELTPMQILAERESIFRLLPQTTPENVIKDFRNYTIDPTSRYPTFNRHLYQDFQMEHLYRSDSMENGNLERKFHPNFHTGRKRVVLRSLDNNMSDRNDLEEFQMIYNKAAESVQHPRSYIDFLSRDVVVAPTPKKLSERPKPKHQVRDAEQLEVKTLRNNTAKRREQLEKNTLRLNKPDKEIIQNKSKIVLPTDPDLDEMLAELENDSDFLRMSENDQKSWLESLFFCDTKNIQRRTPSPVIQPKRKSLPKKKTSKPVQPPPIKKPSPPPPTAAAASSADSSGTGVNMKLCSLAQSFFNPSPSTPAQPKALSSAIKRPPPQQMKKKASPSPIKERVFYEPEHSNEMIPEPEEDFSFLRKKNVDVEPPPHVPPRSTQNKSLMLKLMKNATSALK
uniref:[F-actin]-monooxygenase MICAL1-3-like Rossman domain-containing protein n=1 Tax=Lepeophtheirus salmonis TaxID=72036 RepID=A0A0K2SZ23_LEPSM